MKRIFVFLFFVVVMAVWCTPSFAAQQGIPPSAALNAAGVAEGVTITGAATLTVNGSGGFANIGNLAGVSATNSAINQGIIAFSTTSVVSGSLGGNTNTLADVQLLAGATTVTFNGAVYSVLMKVAAGTTAVFNDGSILNKAAVDFTGDGTINVAANTKVTGALTNTAGADTGTLNLYGATSGTDQWTGAIGGATGLKSINVVGGTNTAGIFSKITGAVDVYDLELATNTLNVAGTLTLHGSSIINTTLASSSVYGHIVPTGAATEVTGLVVNVTVPSGSYIPLGTLFNIVEASSGTGDVPFTITPVGVTNPLYTFSGSPTTTGQVQIRVSGTPIQPLNPVADPVADVTAAAVATLPATAPVVIAINALTTPAAVAAAEAQLAPSTASLASPLLTYQGVRQFQTLWLNRLDSCGQVSWASENKENCKGSTADNGWWLKGFGYFGQQDSRSGFTSYDARILGSMIAYDRSLGLNTRAGLGVGYARTNIKGTVYDANTESDTYRAVAYIGHEMGSWFFDGSGSFGWNEYRDRRHVEFSGVDTTAKSKYNGQDYTAFGRAGFHLPSIFEFIITPMASLQYTRVNIDGHTEKGSTDDINMRVRSQQYDYLESGLGGKVERPFNYNSKFTFVPEAHFEWLHKLSNPRIKQTAVYIDSGSAFTTPSLRTVADSYHAGVGLNLLSCACSATVWSIETGYDYYWRTDGYAANQISMRFSRRF